jgi:lysophospholipase L1-like esterase
MKLSHLVSAIALSFLLVGCGTIKEATYRLASISMSPTLVVLGDSVSAGVYVSSNDVYPRLLADDLHAQLTVYAIPGHTTAETHSMYIGELAPTYAVIELGTNDYNHGVPLATFAADYESVVESISPTTKEVCLSLWDPNNTTDARWSSPLGISSRVNKVGASPAKYNSIIAHLCRGTYLSVQALYDIPAYHGSGSPGPLYHPNAAGDAAIARLVFAVFSSSLASRTNSP